MIGEDIFQLHVATPTCTACPMSLYKTRQDTTGSPFPAGVQLGLLSLLVCKKEVFFPCWYLNESSSLLVLYKFPNCIGNQIEWPLVIKHINWVDNHPMIISAKYGSHHFTGYRENAFLTIFPIISLWELPVAMATKLRGRSPSF